MNLISVDEKYSPLSYSTEQSFWFWGIVSVPISHWAPNQVQKLLEIKNGPELLRDKPLSYQMFHVEPSNDLNAPKEH